MRDCEMAWREALRALRVDNRVGELVASSNSTSDLVRVAGTTEGVGLVRLVRFGEGGLEVDAIGRLGATLASVPLEGSARESMMGFREGRWKGA